MSKVPLNLIHEPVLAAAICRISFGFIHYHIRQLEDAVVRPKQGAALTARGGQRTRTLGPGMPPLSI